MALITRDLDENSYPDWDWWEDEIDYLVEQAATRGIDIGTDTVRSRGKTLAQPAVSFSGFYSQGDGLAFDATINWPIFFEAHSDFKEKHINWFLLLVSNPDYFDVGVHRYNGRSNNMWAELENNYPDIIECGFFAGLEMEANEGQMPLLDGSALERYILEACEEEAADMYRALEAVYEAEREYTNKCRVEILLEEHQEQLKELLWCLPAEFSLAAIEHETIDWDDLDTLGLVEPVGRGGYIISAAGMEVMR